MKIVALQAENFKRLRAVEIRPNGVLVQITGKNGNGKTSVLDALWVAILGAKVAPAEPIRHGAERCRIRVDLGELVVTRTFARKEDGGYTTELRVENADGLRLPGPQSVLDALCNALTFDPLEFMRKKPAEKFEALKTFVPGVNFDKIAADNQKDYEARTGYNRAAKQAQAAADLIQVPDGTPEEPVDESALTAQLAGAAEHNTSIERRKLKRQQVAQSVANMRQAAQASRDDAEERRRQAQALLEQAADLEESATAEDARADEQQQRLETAPALPEPIDTTQVQRQISAARTTNTFVRQRDQRDAHLKNAAENEAAARECTERMEARESAKQAAIAAAKMPVPGLGFGDGVVMLNGVPIEQASDAEQLTASVLIAKAMNPKLRVLRIRDGSLLDDDSKGRLAQLLEEGDWQCWMEVVDSSGKVGFVLEDGALKNAGASPKPAEASDLPDAPARGVSPAARRRPTAPAAATAPASPRRPPPPSLPNLPLEEEL